jgi:hypothetical protein
VFLRDRDGGNATLQLWPLVRNAQGAEAGRWRDVDLRGTSPRLCVWPHVLPPARIVVSGHVINCTCVSKPVSSYFNSLTLMFYLTRGRPKMLTEVERLSRVLMIAIPPMRRHRSISAIPRISKCHRALDVPAGALIERAAMAR